MNHHRAVFMDRDGTLIVECHYLSDPDQVELLPGVVEALHSLRRAGFALYVVTNQAGLAHGLFDEHKLRLVHIRLEELLGSHGLTLDGIRYCPHHPEGIVPQLTVVCRCRKPAPGLIQDVLQETGLSPRHCYMIGDKRVDIAAGHASGCKSILVLTGYGSEERERAEGPEIPDFTAVGLVQAVGWILANKEE